MRPQFISTHRTPSNFPSHSPTRRFANSHVTTLGHMPLTRCCRGLRTLASTQRCRAYATSWTCKTRSNTSWMTYDDRRGGWWEHNSTLSRPLTPSATAWRGRVCIRRSLMPMRMVVRLSPSPSDRLLGLRARGPLEMPQLHDEPRRRSCWECGSTSHRCKQCPERRRPPRQCTYCQSYSHHSP